MARLRRIGALLLLLALASGSMAVAAQRSSDRQMKDLLGRIDKRTDAFRFSFDRAIDRNPINGSPEEDQINRSLTDFERSTDRLRDRVNNHESGAPDVEKVLSRASLIDSFMMRNQLDAAAEDDWKDLRQDLDQLAFVYGVTWNWTRFGNILDRVDDEQLEQLLQRIAKGAHQFRASLDKALDESPMDSSTVEDDIDQLVTEFAETTDHLKDHFSRNEVVTKDVLRRGVSIDGFMKRHRLNEQAQNDWLRLRRDLDDLARAYHLAWSWSDLQYTPGNFGTELYHRLTGTCSEPRAPELPWLPKRPPCGATSSQR